MDRNSVIGLLVIGAILIGFSYFNSPTDEEVQRAKAQKERNDSIAAAKESESSSAQANQEKSTEKQGDSTSKENNFQEKKSSRLGDNWVAKTDSTGKKVINKDGYVIFKDTVNDRDTIIKIDNSKTGNARATSENMAEQLGSLGSRFIGKDTAKTKNLKLENDKIIVNLSNAGGRITSVYLKKYEAYKNYDRNEEKITPLKLFDKKRSTYGLTFPWNNQRINTDKLYFDVEESSSDRIVFRLPFEGSEQYLEYTYSIEEGKYDVSYDINFQGLGEKINGDEVLFDTEFELLQTEHLMSEQRRYSSIFYKYENDGYNYLWENSDDELEAEYGLDWVSFKQSYFNVMMMSDEGFGSDSYMQVRTLTSDKYILNYVAQLDLEISNTDNANETIEWYFGPNDYEILASYGNESEDIINYGWGLFRWVNIYMILPVFNLFTGWGVGIGIAIFLLTLVVKLLLSPITFRMYKSSAKMRVLKPEIKELNEKYPDKADAMKKQQEMMKLYNQTGVNPLAGCIPMLIQMPILFAVFRFFPSSISLRQESFLWANDLSAYDSILNFGFNIPLYGDHISLFTLLMAGTTLIYTMYNSSNMSQPSQPGMPNMKIIMYIFPIMMIFFFNNFAAGLSYYYFISNLLSIAIMFAIKTYFVDEDKLRAKIDEKKSDPQKAKKKSKFQERLETAQKMQQEKKNNKNK